MESYALNVKKALFTIISASNTPLIAVDGGQTVLMLNETAATILQKNMHDCLKRPLVSVLPLRVSPNFSQERGDSTLFTCGGRFYRLNSIGDYACDTAIRLYSIIDVSEEYNDLEMYEFLKNDAPIGVFQIKLDDDFTVTYASERFYKMHGYTAVQFHAELRGKAVRLIHPDHLARVRAQIESARQMERPTFAFEMQIICRDGTMRWLLTQGTLVTTISGTLLYGYISDCTAFKVMQRTTTDLLEVCRFTVNHDYNSVALVDLASGGYESFLAGRNEMGEALESGKFSEFVKNKAAQKIFEPDRAAYIDFLALTHLPARLLDPTQPHELRYRLSVNGRSPRWHLMRAFFFNTDQSKILVCVRDIEQEEQRKQALQTALAEAEHANSAKSDFLSRMSHDIRTPMNAIIGMATIGRMHMADEARIGECLNKILISSHFLLSLINDILDVSKIESGKLDLSCEQFDFSEVISSVTTLTYNDAADRNIRFDVSVDPFLERRYVGDALRLKQILMNLLSNALKFAGGEGKESLVSLRVRPIAQEGGVGLIRFVVTDNGIGMSHDFQKHMFEPFEQETVNQRGLTGTGLGLTITQNLVRLMGGTLTVDSEPGQGATFVVELPLQIPAPEPDYPQTGRRQRFESMHILVVDDDKVTSEHTAALLGRFGAQVDFAGSGREALDLIERSLEQDNRYHLVLLDWSMPELDGIETAAGIRDLGEADAIIVVVTAYDWAQIGDRARAAGVNSFLNKPLFEENLYELLIKMSLQHEEPEEPVDDQNFDGQKLLLVEDNDLNAEIATTLLEMHNLTIVRAENGQIGVERFAASQTGQFAAILMDVRMPVMNGLDATRCIRSLPHPDAKAVPIIAMSANAFAEDVAQSLDAGMNEHVSKPIEIDAVCALLKRFLK